MNEKPNLKRSRSTESIEQALKRVKPFQAESPQISIQEDNVRYPAIKTISISTKTPVNNNNNNNYQHVNHFLSAIHRERHGDPEIRESWWEHETQDVDMEESQPVYEHANAVLRTAFLQRHNQ